MPSRFTAAGLELGDGGACLLARDTNREGQAAAEHDLVQEHGNGFGRTDADLAQDRLGRLLRSGSMRAVM